MSWKDYLRSEVPGLTALKLFEYSTAGPGLARLDCNELAFPPDDADMDVFATELRKIALNRYPDVSARPLREALATRWKVEPDEILLGNGSVETIGMLLTAFGAARRGVPPKLLYPDPSFPYYEIIARVHGVVPLPVELDARFRLDEARIVDTIERERPGLAIFASPNNPSGNRFEPAVLENLARRMDAVFVVDEAYADFDGRTMLPNVRTTPGLCVMRSLSKIGLAGLRLGALVGPREIIAELDKVRLPWNINAVSIALGVAALAQSARLDVRIRAIVDLRRRLEVGLREIPGLVVYPSDANFVLIRIASHVDDVFNRLVRDGVLVKNMSRPGLLQGCLRVTVGTAAENERCLRALRDALDTSPESGSNNPSETGERRVWRSPAYE